MTYCFPKRSFGPAAITAWCAAHGLKAVRGKLVRGVFHVMCKRVARAKGRGRNPAPGPPIGSEWMLDGRPVIVLAHMAEGKVAAHYQDVPPWDPDTRATRPDEFRVVAASRLTKANPKRVRSADPSNAALARQVAELRAIVARLERAKRATRKDAGIRGGTLKRVPFSSNPPRRRRRKNPGSTEIYPHVTAIEARKADGKLYRHDFKKPGPRIIGTKSGSLRIPRDVAKLWGYR